MEQLATSLPGEFVPLLGNAMLVNDFILGMHESSVLRGMSDEKIAQREKAIEATPWWDRFVANLMIFFSIAGHDSSNFFEPQLTLEDALAKRDRRIDERTHTIRARK